MIDSRTGQVIADDEGMRLEFVRVLDTGIEDAWSAITDSERTARWFGSWTGDPGSGQIQLVMTAEDDTTPQAVDIIECTEPTTLTLEVPGPDGIWRLHVVLSARGDTTEMVFTHRLAEPYDASNIGPGWHFYLDRLAAVVDDVAVPDDFDRYLGELDGAYPLPA